MVCINVLESSVRNKHHSSSAVAESGNSLLLSLHLACWIYYCLHFTGGETEARGGYGNLPRVTQLVNGRARIPTWLSGSWVQSSDINPLDYAAPVS